MSAPVLPSQPVVAITGCRRGLGNGLAQAFSRAGSPVIVHARTQAQAESVKVTLDGPAEAVGGDVRDADLGERIVAAAAPFGGVDLLILNAGTINTMGPLLKADLDEFADVMAINVHGLVSLVQAVCPGMVSRGRGAVIWLSSGLGRFGLPGYGAYCASKHAVEGLSSVLAEEHREDGLVSVAVAPGMVQTDMLRTALGVDDVSEHQTPLDTAAGFVALAAGLTLEHSGTSIDIGDWMPG